MSKAVSSCWQQRHPGAAGASMAIWAQFWLWDAADDRPPARQQGLQVVCSTFLEPAALAPELCLRWQVVVLVGDLSYADQHAEDGGRGYRSPQVSHPPRWDAWGRFMQPLAAQVTPPPSWQPAPGRSVSCAVADSCTMHPARGVKPMFTYLKLCMLQVPLMALEGNHGEYVLPPPPSHPKTLKPSPQGCQAKACCRLRPLIVRCKACSQQH